MLEKVLTKIRASKAESLIDDKFRAGKILDIGCGNYPYFLSRTKVKDKVGLDKNLPQSELKGVKYIVHNIEDNSKLPFSDSSFGVVTALAVLEHIDSLGAEKIIVDINRVLKPGAKFIMTVPRGSADKLLRIMSRIGLVSKVEIMEHKQLYNKSIINKQLVKAGFEQVRIKSFEFGVNLAAHAIKKG